MNKYHIEVIGSQKPYKKIIADYMDSNRDGYYVFKTKDVNDFLESVAYFPIHKTCIIEIEYDFEIKNK
jgi:hypothetical protein